MSATDQHQPGDLADGKASSIDLPPDEVLAYAVYDRTLPCSQEKFPLHQLAAIWFVTTQHAINLAREGEFSMPDVLTKAQRTNIRANSVFPRANIVAFLLRRRIKPGDQVPRVKSRSKNRKHSRQSSGNQSADGRATRSEVAPRVTGG